MREPTPFEKKVYKATQKIPKGKVATYKAVAQKIGTKAYRAVGNALNKNPYSIMKCTGKGMVPCHRVVDSKGHLHGFAQGLKKKAKLLKREGVLSKNNVIQSSNQILKKIK